MRNVFGVVIFTFNTQLEFIGLPNYGSLGFCETNEDW